MFETNASKSHALIVALSPHALGQLVKPGFTPEFICASLNELNSLVQDIVNSLQPDAATIDGETLIAMWPGSVLQEQAGFFQKLSLQMQSANSLLLRRKTSLCFTAVVTAGIIAGDVVAINDVILGSAVNTAVRYCNFAREVGASVMMDELLISEWPQNRRQGLKFYELETNGAVKRAAAVEL